MRCDVAHISPKQMIAGNGRGREKLPGGVSRVIPVQITGG